MSITYEIIIIEFHQSKRKCLILGIYNPPIQNETEFLQQLNLGLAFYYPRYENITTIRDFNMTVENHHLSDFMQTLAFSCLTTKPPCHQSKIAACIYLILTNKKNLFKFPDNDWSSDHHMLMSTIMKSGNLKGPLTKIADHIKTLIWTSVILV